MNLGVTADPTLPCVHLPSLVLPDTRPKITRRTLTEHDATLLVAALEDIEARRAALEWLLDRDLLRFCLV